MSHRSLFCSLPAADELLALTLPQLRPSFLKLGSFRVAISEMFQWLADFPGFLLVFGRQDSAGSDTEMSESLFEIACFETGWSRRGSVDNDLQPFLARSRLGNRRV
jgi:hypothetical protein